jgi:DegV family protein with EDD domain
MKIGIVTDSTSDISPEIADRYGIQVVPAIINIGKKSYTDGIEISREDFYNQLPDLNPPPQTATPSAGTFQETYEGLFRQGVESILSFHPSSKLSGVFNTAWVAAKEFGKRVHVFDSEQISLGLGFQAILAAESARAGTNMDRLLQGLEQIRNRVRLVALLDSIEYIRRSGRVSWALAKIGGLLHLHPLMEVRQGTVHRLGQVRTRQQGIERLIDELNSWGPLERLAVLHTNAEATARKLLESVRDKVKIPPLIVNVTTVIGTHVGPNALGFTAVPIS